MRPTISCSTRTGGFAWSNDQFVRTQLTGTLNGATAGADEAVNKGLIGWTGGGGIAYAFAQNWNVFAEYRYTSFGTSTVSLPLSQLTTTTTMTVSTLEFGVNYKFNVEWRSSPAGMRCRLIRPELLPSQLWSISRRLVAIPTIGAEIYFGGDGGFGWDDRQGDAVGCREQSAQRPMSYRVNGPVAGLFAGGNYQFNKIVLGVEGDWQWSNLIGNSQTACAARCRWHIPFGTFYGFDHGQGLRLRPRPLGVRVSIVSWHLAPAGGPGGIR